MKTPSLPQSVLDKLVSLAQKSTSDSTEDFDPSDGGNFDDAYYMGTEDGEIYLAREVLTALGVDWRKP